MNLRQPLVLVRYVSFFFSKHYLNIWIICLNLHWKKIPIQNFPANPCYWLYFAGLKNFLLLSFIYLYTHQFYRVGSNLEYCFITTGQPPKRPKPSASQSNSACRKALWGRDYPQGNRKLKLITSGSRPLTMLSVVGLWVHRISTYRVPSFPKDNVPAATNGNTKPSKHVIMQH